MKALNTCSLVIALTMLSTLLIGCSKKPLEDKTIAEVRQMVDDWNFGRLAQQQSEPLPKAKREAVEQEIQEAKDALNAAMLEVDALSKMDAAGKFVEGRDRVSMQYFNDVEASENATESKLREGRHKIAAEWKAKRNEIITEWEGKQKAVRSGGKSVSALIRELDAKYKPMIDAIDEKALNKKDELEAATDRDFKAEKERLHKAYAETLVKLEAEYETAQQRMHEAEAKSKTAKEKVRRAEAKLDTRLEERLIHSAALFYKVFGKPNKKQLLGDNYYFYYKCKDGMIQFEINHYALDRFDDASITSVNLF